MGGYLQSGYFFHHLISAIPESLEFAARYAFVEEPNKENLAIDNDRQEITLAANWFFKGHNNKLTLDWSHLSLDDNRLNDKESESRIRLQWDVSFLYQNSACIIQSTMSQGENDAIFNAQYGELA